MQPNGRVFDKTVEVPMPNDPDVDVVPSGRAAILRVAIATLAAAPTLAVQATGRELAAPVAVLVLGPVCWPRWRC